MCLINDYINGVFEAFEDDCTAHRSSFAIGAYSSLQYQYVALKSHLYFTK